MLGQYFARSEGFRGLRDSEAESGPEREPGRVNFQVVWLHWWSNLEKEVREAIKPEIKAVYDTRCSSLFYRSKLHFRSIFMGHGQGPEKALSIQHLQTLCDDGIWALYQSRPNSLTAGGSGVLSWERFWEDTQPILKAAIKDHIRRVVKDEMQIKFTDFRRRFHEVFRQVDEHTEGVIQAPAYLQALKHSPLAELLDLQSPNRDGAVKDAGPVAQNGFLAPHQ